MSEAALLARSVLQAFHARYPERADEREDAFTRVLKASLAHVPPVNWRCRGRRLRRFSRVVTRARRDLAGLDDAELRRRITATRRILRRDGLQERHLPAALALLCRVAETTLGVTPHDVQVQGAFVLVHDMLAEMETGEGKTVTAALAAAAAALAGIPTHIVTVNDYLTERDSGDLAGFYGFLGLQVGRIVAGMRPAERREAYAADITYCTNKELAFDYLRDRLSLGHKRGDLRLKVDRLTNVVEDAERLMLRGLHFAIIDEADSVLIDEARTPLIISDSAAADKYRDNIGLGLSIARRLEDGVHFRILANRRAIELTDSGRRRIDAESIGGGRIWRSPIAREELIRLALTAVHLYHSDEHYLIRDGKVTIIDEYTGRTMADRYWGAGLHQLIELKEGCEPSPHRATLARMTYQRFFRRYIRLSGMTGTAREVKRELRLVYRLPVVSLPTHRPCLRARRPDLIVSTEDAKWSSIVKAIATAHAKGQPVLLGTRTVAAAKAASERLRAAGLDHFVLSAAQDKEEADIIAKAGQSGRITIATNMAGRGTDIRLGPGVAELGGLFVIMSERHNARRTDRQLAGRCARQGDPGVYQAILSLEDPLVMRYAGLFGVDASRIVGRIGGRAAARFVIRRAQRAAERTHFAMRRELLKVDRAIGDLLAFAGQRE
jgi:preprotein translocase subunit SecA